MEKECQIALSDLLTIQRLLLEIERPMVTFRKDDELGMAKEAIRYCQTRAATVLGYVEAALRRDDGHQL